MVAHPDKSIAQEVRAALHVAARGEHWVGQDNMSVATSSLLKNIDLSMELQSKANSGADSPNGKSVGKTITIGDTDYRDIGPEKGRP